ncbi:MAG: leucine-rich repeat protein [Firmicutes bacterium]|nr:leucine-rich repeat protein [Bacillota bacterium]
MKRIRKPLFLSLILSLIVLLPALSLAACPGGAKELPAPQDLSVSGTSFAWTAVPDSSGYFVQINENAEVNVGKVTSYNIVSLDVGTHTLKVKAVGDGEKYTDSDWASLAHTVYAITYDLSGGANHSNNPTRYSSESATITLQNPPARSGYTFTGWAEGGTIPAGSTGDKTFTATWATVDYTITYVLDGSTNHASNPQGYNVESPLITLQNPTIDDEDYVFAYWAGGNTIPAGSTGDKTFTAKWTKKGTEGLLYTLAADSLSYGVSRGTATASDVVIQEYYDGLPVTSIVIRGFRNHTDLKNIVLPDSITTIGASAFNGCIALENIILPNSVTIIGNSAFEGCVELKNIELSNSITSIGGVAFDSCISLKSIVLPNSATNIGSSAFNNCTGLESIVLPNTLTTLEQATFGGCSSLTSILLPNTLKTIGDGVFTSSGLESIVIPNSVTSLGQAVFAQCYDLTSAVIGSSLTTIPYRAFEWCTSLTSVVIPASVRRIEDRAFLHCTSLSDIYFKGTQSQWNSITVAGNNAIPAEYNITIHYNWVG